MTAAKRARLAARQRLAAKALGVAGALVIAAVMAIWLTAGSSADGADARHAATPRQRAVVAPVSSGDRRPSGYPEVAPPATLPGSLDGTQPDGDVSADAAGHLVIDIELRRLFDYFLAASGEEPIAVIRARIIAVLRKRLASPAAEEAIAILDRYLAYRDAARQLTTPASAAAGLDQLHDLRGKWLPPAVVTAFFSDEETAIHAALARRDALADPALSPADRDRRLAEIEARIPASVREARAAAMAPVNELARETELRAAGASDPQIAALRTAALGADAATRLAELDRAHAAWDARLARFRAERAALYADRTIDDAERRRRVDDLLARSFTAAERIRVETLDRLAPVPAPP